MSDEAKTENTTPSVKILGDVTPEVSQTLNSLRQASNEVVFRIGRLEVEKQRLMNQLSEMEVRAASLMEQEGKRLGIEPQTTWTINDGKAVEIQGG